jgi:hypothetical protein
LAAAHLCELYQGEKKMSAALRMCRLARSRLGLEKDPLLYRVSDVIKQNDARLEQLSPGSSKTWNMGTIDEIAAMRDWKVPAAVAGTATATAQFVILLEYDPRAGKFKVPDTKYESGMRRTGMRCES